MEMWFTDRFLPGRAVTYKIRETVASVCGDFQKIDVLESEDAGRLLVADGKLLYSEQDAKHIFEMAAHPALAVFGDAASVLVLGDGTGGLATEVLRYRSVKKVVVVQMDPSVSEIAREFFPDFASALDDPRVSLVRKDPLFFLTDGAEKFDVILIESTSPDALPQEIYGEGIVAAATGRLAQGGILNTSVGSLFFGREKLRRLLSALRENLGEAALYQAQIPCRPGGAAWAMAGGKARLARRDVIDGTCQFETGYFDYAVMRAAFCLPAFAKNLQ